MSFAKAGERVQNAETGETICVLKNDLLRHAVVSAHDFHEFAIGEEPWTPGQVLDARCVRLKPEGHGLQIFIEGEWRPE